MKVLFSVYFEDRSTETKTLHFVKAIETNMQFSQIEDFLELNDRFYSELEVSQNLAFWDIYCFDDFYVKVIEKICSIPVDKASKELLKEPSVLVIQHSDPSSASNSSYPSAEEALFYRIYRFECGASGFHTLIAYIQNDPVFAGVVGSAVYQIIDSILAFFWRLLPFDTSSGKRPYKKRKVYFSVKHFNQNFEELTGVEKADFRIVGLQKKRGGLFDVKVRIITGEKYKVVSTGKGKIEFLELLDDKTSLVHY